MRNSVRARKCGLEDRHVRESEKGAGAEASNTVEKKNKSDQAVVCIGYQEVKNIRRGLSGPPEIVYKHVQ
jgi:hypothetical protein